MELSKGRRCRNGRHIVSGRSQLTFLVSVRSTASFSKYAYASACIMSHPVTEAKGQIGEEYDPRRHNSIQAAL